MLKTETSFFAKADLLLESSRLQTRETRRSFGIQSVSKILIARFKYNTTRRFGFMKRIIGLVRFLRG